MAWAYFKRGSKYIIRRYHHKLKRLSHKIENCGYVVISALHDSRVVGLPWLDKRIRVDDRLLAMCVTLTLWQSLHAIKSVSEFA